MKSASKAIGGHPGMVEESPPPKRKRSVLRRPASSVIPRPTETKTERQARLRALIEKKEKVRADKQERRERLWLESPEGRKWLAEVETGMED